jgi:hypothetical protein
VGGGEETTDFFFVNMQNDVCVKRNDFHNLTVPYLSNKSSYTRTGLMTLIEFFYVA